MAMSDSALAIQERRSIASSPICQNGANISHRSPRKCPTASGLIHKTHKIVHQTHMGGPETDRELQCYENGMSATRAHLAQMQLRLPLKQETSRRASTLTVSGSNAVAATALEDWPSEPGSIMALYGPQGCGKSHMAAAWVERVGAIALHGEEASWCDLVQLEGRPVLLEEADGADDDALFHLINLTQSTGGALLMVSRDPPASWMTRLPDLRSRLNAIRTIPVEVPDDAVLAAMLKNAFAARNIVPGEGVIDYLVRRIDRSAQSAEMFVDRLDIYNRPVTRVLARQVLEGDFTAGLS